MYAEKSPYNAGNTAYADSSAQPVREQRFDAPARNLEDMLKGFAEHNMRLSKVADRLAGVAPPSGIEKEAGQRGSIAGVVSRFESITDSYASQLRSLSNTLDRLESL